MGRTGADVCDSGTWGVISPGSIESRWFIWEGYRRIVRVCRRWRRRGMKGLIFRRRRAIVIVDSVFADGESAS